MITSINHIQRETEKALLINVNVSYNANKGKPRDLWFPKSVVKFISDNVVDIKDWFAQKLSNENAFHGYSMDFADRHFVMTEDLFNQQ